MTKMETPYGPLEFLEIPRTGKTYRITHRGEETRSDIVKRGSGHRLKYTTGSIINGPRVEITVRVVPDGYDQEKSVFSIGGEVVFSEFYIPSDEEVFEIILTHGPFIMPSFKMRKYLEHAYSLNKNKF